MPRLLSGSTLRSGGSGDFIDLKGAMPQLPANSDTSTGYTIVTDSVLRTSYRSSLGNLEMYKGEIYSNLPDGIVKLKGTGTGFVFINSTTIASSTTTGALVVAGGVGIGGTLWTDDDIHVNGLTIGQGFKGSNNVVIQGTPTVLEDNFPNGEGNISIGWGALENIYSADRTIAIGRYALSSGTNILNSVAIGDSALKSLGIVPTSLIKNINVINTFTSIAITGATNDNPVVITAPSHSLTSGDRITINDVVGLSTSTFSGDISLVNNKSFWINTLTSDTFELYNSNVFSTATSVNGTLTLWSSYSSAGTVELPVSISVTSHGFADGTAIIIDNVQGSEELNGNRYWIYSLGADTFQIYRDNILSDGVISSEITPYITGGTVHRFLLQDNNIAVGSNAGTSLYDGEQNFFFGDNIAPNLTTGSSNYFMGHDVATFLTTGSGNISIMGDNLVDGVDNQINIGAIFYYNGTGLLDLNTDALVGLRTQSTSSTTGALVVQGGVGIEKDLWVGGIIHGTIEGSNNGGVSSSTNAIFVNTLTTSSIYYLGLVETIGDYSPLDSTSTVSYDSSIDQLSVKNISITSGVASTSTNTGQALLIDGGLGISGGIYGRDGNADEGNLIYTPRVTVSTSSPLNPRVGDFWIDPTYGVELQWIKDGTSTFWIQFTGL